MKMLDKIRLVQSRFGNSEPIPIPKKHQFRTAWRWSKTIEDFIKIWLGAAYSLHVCCGQSTLGTVRIDLDPDSRRTHEGDMNKIPFGNCEFDKTLADWPWKMGFFQRFRPFYEMVRTTKVGGEILVNAPWIPFSEATFLKDVYIRSDIPFGMLSAILIFVKITDMYDDYAPFTGE